MKVSTYAVLVVALGLLSSCATVRNMTGGGKAAEPTATSSGEALEPAATVAQIESDLLRQVAQHVEQSEADAANNQNRVIRKKPYYFKEYSDYQSSAATDDISLSETESRTAPYIADVKLEKIRYATRLHRSREDARLDNVFLRDTGVETLSYELRSGRWVRVGSFFQSEKTEEQIDGNWVVADRVIQRTVVAEEPEKGWLGKSWSFITGGN